MASTAGLMLSTKKPKITKIPAKPTPIFKADINAAPKLILAAIAMMKIKNGSMTYAWKEKKWSRICLMSSMITPEFNIPVKENGIFLSIRANCSQTLTNLVNKRNLINEQAPASLSPFVNRQTVSRAHVKSKLAIILIVITSYSIHYTKLYE